MKFGKRKAAQLPSFTHDQSTAKFQILAVNHEIGHGNDSSRIKVQLGVTSSRDACRFLHGKAGQIGGSISQISLKPTTSKLKMLARQLQRERNRAGDPGRTGNTEPGAAGVVRAARDIEMSRA